MRSATVSDTLDRVRSDVHPPLYFLLLDGWTQFAGESVYALRLMSALSALAGLAATYAIGARLFDSVTGLAALALLMSASFFIYYAREARMYSLLLALAALAMWAYLRWRRRPTLRRALVYAACMAALLYTHYAGALVIVAQVFHALPGGLRAAGRRRSAGAGALRPWLRAAAPYLVALLLFAPWLPVLAAQTRANPNGPLAIPVSTDWGTAAALALILTSGSGWLMALPLLLAAVPRGRSLPAKAGFSLPLLALWLLLTPAALLALNVWLAPVYQVRYTIAILPAGALLLACALRRVRVWGKPFSRLLSVLLLLALVGVQLAAYPALWPGKPAWEATIRQMIAARGPLEPALTDFAPYSPAGYYDRALRVRRGIALDLSWRPHHAGELQALADRLDGAPSVWLALPTNTAPAWHLAAMLGETRGAGFRSGLANMVFYRFDQQRAPTLRFRFGDLLRYERGAGANARFDVAPGAALCPDFTFTSVAPLSGEYSAGLHVVDLTGARSLVQHDGGLGKHDTGETIRFAPCLTIPSNAAPGYYHLELAVYPWATGQRLLVIEDGAGAPVSWGDVMRLAAVTVSE